LGFFSTPGERSHHQPCLFFLVAFPRVWGPRTVQGPLPRMRAREVFPPSPCSPPGVIICFSRFCFRLTPLLSVDWMVVLFFDRRIKVEPFLSRQFWIFSPHQLGQDRLSPGFLFPGSVRGARFGYFCFWSDLLHIFL